MLIILLFIILSVLGYFMFKAARYGALNPEETSIFALVSIGLAVFLIIIITRSS
jgi:hypothetical protein